MAHKERHIEHVGSRKGFEARHTRTGEIRAFGALTFPTVYGQGLSDDWQEWKDKQRRRPWMLEHRHPSGHWLTSTLARNWTIGQALNYCKGQEDIYRVVHLVEGSNATYRPVLANKYRKDS